jgi:hypothetical protein
VAGDHAAAGLSVGIVDYPTDVRGRAQNAAWLHREGMLSFHNLVSGIGCALIAVHRDVLAMIIHELHVSRERGGHGVNGLRQKLVVVHPGCDPKSQVLPRRQIRVSSMIFLTCHGSCLLLRSHGASDR